MNVLFLSPQFPPQFYLFCTALRARGVHVLGIGDSPWDELNPRLREALAEYVPLADLHHYDDVMRATAGLIHRHGRIDRLDSLTEYWLELEARLREDFNVPGQRPADTARNRSKSSMREIFRAAGVPSSEGEKLRGPEHARELVRRLGYPVVFKPDVGVGSARTFKVQNDEELARALETPLHGYVVERYETGRLTSFDGLTDRAGNIVFSVSHKYNIGIMEVVNGRLDMNYYTRREIPPALEELGRRTVAAFGIRERFFHFELFEDDDGHFRALEINVRPPGGFTTDLMNFACDTDVYGLWADVISGADVSGFTFERKYFTAHIARRDGIAYAHTADEVRARFGPLLLKEGRMPPGLAGAMGDDFFVMRHPEEDVLVEAIRFVEQRAS